MRRRIALILTFVFFFSALIFGVVYLNNPVIFKKQPEQAPTTRPATYRTTYYVMGGEIPYYYSASGNVVSGRPDLYLEELLVERVTEENFELMKKEGDEITEGESLYSLKGKEKVLDYHAKLVSVEWETSNGAKNVRLGLLNYDKLYITALVSESKIARMKYDMPVEVTLMGKSYPAEILRIGYEVSGGTVPVYVSLPVAALPGTAVELSFLMEVKQMGLYIMKDALYQNGNDWYADVYKDGNVIPTKVRIGQHFYLPDQEFEYVEILSGDLEYKDAVIVEELITTGEDLKESLE